MTLTHSPCIYLICLSSSNREAKLFCGQERPRFRLHSSLKEKKSTSLVFRKKNSPMLYDNPRNTNPPSPRAKLKFLPPSSKLLELRNQLLPEPLSKPRHKEERQEGKKESERTLYIFRSHILTTTTRQTKPISFRLGKVARIRIPDRVPVADLNEPIFFTIIYFCNVNSKHQQETLNK